jgi:hypothetical protein
MSYNPAAFHKRMSVQNGEMMATESRCDLVEVKSKPGNYNPMHKAQAKSMSPISSMEDASFKISVT